MRKTAFTLFIIATVLMTACDGKVYDKYSHTPIAGWEKNDTLAFYVPKMAAAGVYGMDLGLRINNAYPFMRLTLIVEQNILPSRKTKVDTLNCELVDGNGNVEGQGVSYYQYNFHVGDIELNQGDSLYITVRHDMKREILPGVSDVGIVVNREPFK